MNPIFPPAVASPTRQFSRLLSDVWFRQKPLTKQGPQGVIGTGLAPELLFGEPFQDRFGLLGSTLIITVDEVSISRQRDSRA